MATRKVLFDFREGIDGSKIVYKDEKFWDGKVVFGYLGWLLLTWIYASGWFALFLFTWIYDRKSAFIIYIVIWGVCIFLLLIIFGRNLLKFYASERRIKNEKLKREKQEQDKLQNDIVKAQEESPVKKNGSPSKANNNQVNDVNDK